jgi:hypothetical protein
MYSPKVTIQCNRIYRIFESSNFNIKSIQFTNYSVKQVFRLKMQLYIIKESEISFGIPDTEASFFQSSRVVLGSFQLHSKNVERFLL